jgi:hypothetical protein
MATDGTQTALAEADRVRRVIVDRGVGERREDQKIDKSHISKMLRLTLLAADIVELILESGESGLRLARPSSLWPVHSSPSSRTKSESVQGWSHKSKERVALSLLTRAIGPSVSGNRSIVLEKRRNASSCSEESDAKSPRSTAARRHKFSSERRQACGLTARENPGSNILHDCRLASSLRT